MVGAGKIYSLFAVFLLFSGLLSCKEEEIAVGNTKVLFKDPPGFAPWELPSGSNTLFISERRTIVEPDTTKFLGPLFRFDLTLVEYEELTELPGWITDMKVYKDGSELLLTTYRRPYPGIPQYLIVNYNVVSDQYDTLLSSDGELLINRIEDDRYLYYRDLEKSEYLYRYDLETGTEEEYDYSSIISISETANLMIVATPDEYQLRDLNGNVIEVLDFLPKAFINEGTEIVGNANNGDGLIKYSISSGEVSILDEKATYSSRLQVSRSEELLIYIAQSPQLYNDLYVADFNGNNRRRITNDIHEEYVLGLYDNESKILYKRDGDSNLYSVSVKSR